MRAEGDVREMVSTADCQLIGLAKATAQSAVPTRDKAANRLKRSTGKV